MLDTLEVLGIDTVTAWEGVSWMREKQFDSFTASELYCARCKCVRAVRERLLLVLTTGEISAYRCVVCGDALATREVKATQSPLIITK